MNRYANLVGSNKIKDEWQKINNGFDAVQSDMDGKAPSSTATDLAAHVGNSTIHVTAQDKTNWNGKAPGNTRTDLDSHVANNVVHVTQSDHDKLNSVQTGAEVNQNAFARIAVSGQSDIDADDPSATLTLKNGIGITITTNPLTGEVTWTATGEAAPAPHGSTHIGSGSDPIPGATLTDSGIVMLDNSTSSTSTTKAATANAVKTAKDAADAAQSTANTAQSTASATQTNLDNHIADYIRQPGYGTTAGTATAYTLTLTPALAAYAAGVCVAVKIHAANTGAATISINGLGAKSILDSKGNAMTAGKLRLNGVYTLRYDGTNFILQGEGGDYGTAGAAQVLTGYTIGTDSGLVNGTMPNRAGDTAALSSAVAGTTLKLLASNGYRDGVDDYVTIADPNFLAANLPNGLSLFGIVGTGANVKRWATGTTSVPSGGAGLLIVTGLAFTPRYVLGYITNVNTTAIRSLIFAGVAEGLPWYNGSTLSTSYQGRAYTDSGNSNKGDMGGTYSGFTSDGFQIQAYNNFTYRWYAFE